MKTRWFPVSWMARVLALVAALVLPHPSALLAAIVAGPITNAANGHFYYLLGSNSWTSSETEAVTLGGHLVTISDAAENHWVYTNFITYGGVQRPLWIGLTDRRIEGTWEWVSGESPVYLNWITGEPNNNMTRGPQNWAMMWPPAVNGLGSPYAPEKWNDYWDLPTVVDASLTNLMMGMYGVVEVVPPRWLEWPAASGGNGHYYALTSTATNWAAAEAEAVSFGGHLVSVSNAAEHAFLEATFFSGTNRLKSRWLGFNDVATEGTFVWSSGEPVTYTNWSPSQPNGGGGLDNYAVLNGLYVFFNGTNQTVFGLWNDEPLNGKADDFGTPFPHFGIMELSFNPGGLLWISPGTFTMGSPTNELDRAPEEGPQHTVTLTRGFWMTKYEVTQAEFISLFGSNPGANDGSPNLPARGVTWLECLHYCDLLTERERAAGRLPAGFTYRLPTEAEWEYACRAGTSTRFSYGDDPTYAQIGTYTWFLSNTVAPHFPQPVGLKMRNPWGLYDIHGNVSEYCLDWLGSYSAGAQLDPSGVESGTSRVVRGGNSFGSAASCRSAGYRGGVPPNGRNYGCGLRVVLAEEPPHRTLFATGFEASEGYSISQPWIGQQGWTRGNWSDQLPSGGQGVGTNLLPGSTQQAFIGGAPGATNPGVHVALARTLNYTPASPAEGVLEFSWTQSISDSTNGARNFFEWLFWNQSGQMLCGVHFSNSSRSIWQRLGDGSALATGLTYTRGQPFEVKVRLDFTRNLWTATIGATVLPPQPIATGGEALNLDGFNLLWWSDAGQAPVPGGPVAGDNRLVLDNMRVTASGLESSSPDLVSIGSIWKYLDNGSNQGTNWTSPNFNDGAWTSGPAQLGYGDSDEATVVSFGANANAKYITTYFRRAFVASDVWGITNLTLGLLRDDGGIVYLNGVEVFRSNLPQGPATYATFASSAVTGADEAAFVTTSLNPALLVEGTNVFAVEIHQSTNTSTDLSFDLYLNADLAPTHPSLLTLTNAAGTFTFERDAAVVGEGATNALLNVRRLGGGASVVSVDYQASSGSALTGLDFVALNGTLFFAPNETLKQITIPILDDTLPENDETFTVRLSSPAGGANLAGSTNVLVTILDDDGVIELVQTNLVVPEISRSVTVPLRWTGSTNRSVSVTVQALSGNAVSGLDYVAFGGPLTFAAGQTLLTPTVEMRDDFAVEVDETFSFRLSNPSAGARLGATNAIITILDNDAPGSVGRGANEYIETIAMQPDGKALIGGNATAINGEQRTNVTLLRLGTNGLRDTTYSAAVLNNALAKLALAADGKVLAGGYFSTVGGQPRGRIARFNTNGTLDTNFTTAAGANFGVSEVVALPAGKVLIGGDFTAFDGVPRSHVARLNTNGTLDTTFDPGTSIDTPYLFALNAQTNGKVLIGGFFNTVQGQPKQMLARLDTNGALDTSFNPGNLGPDSTVNFINVLPDGKLLIGGWFENYNGVPRKRIARLLPDGALDPAFVPNWDATNSTTWNAALQSDGKVIVVGWHTSLSGSQPNYIARLRTNGQLDTSFQIGPGANAPVTAVGVLPDDRVLLGGQFTVFNGFNRYRLAYLNANGSQPDEPMTWTQWPAASGGNDHWYALTKRPNNWTNAEMEAVTNVAHLVSVNDAAEQNYLETNFVKGLNRIRPFWIGLNDAASEGNFAWSSGEPVSFTKWYQGEPSHSSAGEDFAAMNWFYSYWLGDQIEPAFGRWVDVTQAGTIGGNYTIGPYFGIMETTNNPFAPFITQQPQGRIGSIFAEVLFTVTAAGSAPLSYQWYFNGTTAIAGGTNATLQLMNLQPANIGGYSVVVSNAFGQAVSEVAALEVLLPPAQAALAPDMDTTLLEIAPDNNMGGGAILKSGTTQNGTKNRALLQFDLSQIPSGAVPFSLSLALRVTGEPVGGFLPANYRLHRLLRPWGEGTKPDRDDGTFFGLPAGANEATWNHRFAASANVWAAPGAAPTIDYVATASATQLIQGTAASPYSFSSPGLLADVQQWMAEPQTNFGWILICEQEATSGTARRFGSRESGTNAPQLTIQYVQPVAAPAITTQPQNQTVVVGGTAVFSVAAIGTPSPHFQWLLNGNPLGGATNATLTLSNVQPAHAGSYHVIISNAAGAVSSAMAALTVQPCLTTPDGLVAWWRAEDGAFDSIGTNHGTLINGAAFATGRVGRAFNLDGLNDYVDLGNLATLDGAAEITVLCWLRKASTNNPLSGFVGKYDDGPNTTHQNTFLLYNGNGPYQNKGAFLAIFDDDDGGDGSIAGVTEIPVGEWTMVTGTWRNSDGYTAIYKNGALDAAIANTNGVGKHLNSHRSYSAKIGEWGVLRDSRYKFHGDIDEVAIFNRALSSNEVAAIHAAGSAGMCPPCAPPPSGLVAWWPGDGNADDFAGTNHGMLFNGTALANGLVGHALSFDGEDDYVLVPDCPQWHFGQNNFTIELWVKLARLKASMFLHQQSGSGNGGWEFDVQPSISALVFARNPAQAGIQRSWLPQTNEWYHLAVTRSTGTYRLYVNGTQLGAEQFDPNPVADVTGPIRIGDFAQGSADYHLSGLLDEVAIFNRALTSNEIATLYAAGSAGLCKPDFADGTPRVLVDGRLPFDGAVTVTNSAIIRLESVLTNASIYYTLDGAPPIGGIFYTGAFVLREPALVRAVAFDAAFRPAGEADPVWVDVVAPPVILTPPAGRTVGAGADVTLAVAAAGSEPLHFQWVLNGLPVPGANEPVLVMTNLQPIRAGNYTVVISNAFGAVTSAPVLVVVHAPPTFLAQPTNVTVSVGGTAIFTASAVGPPPLEFQWRKNGVNIAGATSSTFTISPVQLDDGASYTVVVASPGGTSESQPARLTVTVPSPAPNDQFAAAAALTGAGGSATGTNNFATREPGEPMHAGKPGSNSVWYTWTAPARGIAIFRTTGSTFDTLLGIYAGEVVNNLTNIASDEDSGGFLTSKASFNANTGVTYRVAIDGFNGQQGGFVLRWELAETNATLPVITCPPASRTVLPGQDASFSVSANGAALSYQWIFNGTPIAVATNATFIRSNALPPHVGFYSVRVSGSGQTVESAPAILEIGPLTGQQSRDKAEDVTVGCPGGFAPTSSGGASVAMGAIGYHFLVGNSINNLGNCTTMSCGGIPVGTRYLELEPTVSGTLLLDTIGSASRTKIWVCRMGINNLDLTRTFLRCDEDDLVDGRSRLSVPVEAGRGYQVWVARLDSAPGDLKLNWQLGVPPRLASLSPHLFVTEGAPMTLSATATNFIAPGVTTPLAPPTYQWFFGSTLLATEPTLTVPAMQPAFAGPYRVVIANTLGTTSAVVRVEVHAAASRAVVSSGEVAELFAADTTDACGAARATYQWRLNGAVLTGETNRNLVLRGTQTQQAGPYSVTVSNCVGVVTYPVAQIAVTVDVGFNAQMLPGGLVVLRWRSVPGRHYRVEFRPSMSADWQPLRPDLTAGTASDFITDQPGFAPRFYRIVLLD